MTVYQIKKVIL